MMGLFREERINITDYFRLFERMCPWSPRDTWRSPEGTEKGTSWAAPVLLGWAGLLGHRELMAAAALQRDSSAQEQLLCTRSRAEGSACSTEGTGTRQREGNTVWGGRMLRCHLERNLQRYEARGYRALHLQILVGSQTAVTLQIQ